MNVSDVEKIMSVYCDIEPDVSDTNDGGKMLIYERESKEVTFVISEDWECHYVAEDFEVIRESGRITENNQISSLSVWMGKED